MPLLDPDDLRAIQDWRVRYKLLSAKGVAEVASVGGYVRQYQVEVDPDAWRDAYGLRPGAETLRDIREALNENAEATTINWLDLNGFRPKG